MVVPMLKTHTHLGLHPLFTGSQRVTSTPHSWHIRKEFGEMDFLGLLGTQNSRMGTTST